MAVRGWFRYGGAVAVAMVVCGIGCASRPALSGLTDQFVRQGDPAVEVASDVPSFSVDPPPMDAIERVLRDARPEPRAVTPSLESQHPVIVSALRAVAVDPSSERYRQLGDEYLRLGVKDAAHEQFTRAIELDRKNAAAWDGRARIWRDWGFSRFGLGDAYRAIAMAPHSPVPHNTLGTIFLRLGNQQAAREAFERALSLDATAGYALHNLCATVPASDLCQRP